MQVEEQLVTSTSKVPVLYRSVCSGFLLQLPTDLSSKPTPVMHTVGKLMEQVFQCIPSTASNDSPTSNYSTLVLSASTERGKCRLLYTLRNGSSKMENTFGVDSIVFDHHKSAQSANEESDKKQTVTELALQYLRKCTTFSL